MELLPHNFIAVTGGWGWWLGGKTPAAGTKRRGTKQTWSLEKGWWKAANETGFFPINTKNKDGYALMSCYLAPVSTCMSCTDSHCYPVTATQHA